MLPKNTPTQQLIAFAQMGITGFILDSVVVSAACAGVRRTLNRNYWILM
jgi:hypothetical protein